MTMKAVNNKKINPENLSPLKKRCIPNGPVKMQIIKWKNLIFLFKN